jgi:hypothetical protein
LRDENEYTVEFEKSKEEIIKEYEDNLLKERKQNEELKKKMH